MPLSVAKLSALNVALLQPAYQAFAAQARSRYGWETDPIPFDLIELAIYKGQLQGAMLCDTPASATTEQVVAFCLYKQEAHNALEINVLAWDDAISPKVVLAKLMPALLKQWQALPHWDVVSYAMLGRQAELIDTMTWYGFKPHGQSIVRFNLLDPLSTQVFKNQEKLPELTPDYRFTTWEGHRRVQVANLVYQAFSPKTDALWDPRFRTETGALQVVDFITQSVMGAHLANCTTLLIRKADDAAVGFVFLVQTETIKANIPLIGLLPELAGKGLGNQLMRQLLMNTFSLILQGTLGMTEINATVDTDNWAALKMYRKFGFLEDVNYPHVYLTHQQASRIKPGQWCAVPPA
jgi:ribosomal protein S18 acetylase RimI-like enzyme